MTEENRSHDEVLREALEEHGHRYTEQRAAVYRFLASTDKHPTAEDVFLAVRNDVPVISLATVYKSLETLVSCGLAQKLTYGESSTRYDGRTDPHHHARCLACDRIVDVPGTLPSEDLEEMDRETTQFRVTGYRLEFTGYCASCHSEEAGTAPALA